MNVGVVDVGSNTARLLVARSGRRGLERVHEDRKPLALGTEIEQSRTISAAKLAEVAEAVAEAVAAAHLAGADHVEVLVTSPGRQSDNRDALAHALARASSARVRLLSAEEEARLAYLGALACSPVRAGSVAVCDVGGGSAQIAVGSPDREPAWVRSIDLGSLRLTRRHLGDDPPAPRELAVARAAAQEELARIVPPLPQTALATGGTARALRKLVGSQLGPPELGLALELVSTRNSKEIASSYGVSRWRARLLPAGVLILAQIQQRLGVPLRVARGGLREGAALHLLEQDAAAA